MKKLITILSVCALVLGTTAPLRADETSSAEVLKKLDEISESQRQILDSLEQMKAELQVIKVRTTS